MSQKGCQVTFFNEYESCFMNFKMGVLLLRDIDFIEMTTLKFVLMLLNDDDMF